MAKKLQPPTQAKPSNSHTKLIVLERQQKKLSYECDNLRKVKESKLLNILSHENYDLLNDLYVATGGPKKLIDCRTNETLNVLIAKHGKYQKEFDKRLMNHREIDEQICLIKKKVIQTQAKNYTDVQYQNRIMEAQRTLEKLENKLDTVVKTWCSVNEENRLLRLEIDHYLQDRQNFRKLWNEKIDNLRFGKKIMLDLIEQATMAYNKRDEIVVMLNALREKSYADFRLQAEEITILQQERDHQRKLKTFIRCKTQKRFMKDLQQAKLRKATEIRDQLSDLLLKNRNTLNSIWTVSDTNSLEEFTNTYLGAESENYSNFLYIFAMKNDVMCFTDDLLELRQKIDDQKKLFQSRGQRQAQNLQNLYLELKTVVSAREAVEKDFARSTKLLGKLFKEIYNLFTLCKTSSSHFINFLGDNTRVNEYNVFLYLTELDEKINLLLLTAYYNQTKKVLTKKPKPGKTLINTCMTPYTMKTIDEIVLKTPCPLCQDKEEVNDVIDVLQFVHNLEDAKQYLKMQLKVPTASEKLHNVSACHLPKSRAIIQRRYQ